MPKVDLHSRVWDQCLIWDKYFPFVSHLGPLIMNHHLLQSSRTRRCSPTNRPPSPRQAPSSSARIFAFQNKSTTMKSPKARQLNTEILRYLNSNLSDAINALPWHQHDNQTSISPIQTHLKQKTVQQTQEPKKSQQKLISNWIMIIVFSMRWMGCGKYPDR